MAQPKYRLTLSRKDGEDITFTNYKGEEVTKKYMPLGALFERDKGPGFSVVIDPAADGVKLDTEKYWVNCYPVDRDEEPRGARGRGNGKPQRRDREERGNRNDKDLEF